MEKLATFLLVLGLSVLASCGELKRSKDEEGKGNRVEEGNVGGGGGGRVSGESGHLSTPYHKWSGKPKLLPLRIVKESGEKRKSTEDILRHLGMSKLKSPANNHRKRLASQSRKSHNEKHLQDSHVYIIKLPPNKYYYDQEAVTPPSPYKSDAPSNINRIPLNFKSNGKPGKIYHWNIPMVKKMVARKTGQPKLGKDHDANQVMKPGLPIWPKEEEEQPLHYRRVSYYKPKKPSKQAFHKYFPGNGKPHSIYVIERSRRPARRAST